MLGTKLLKRCMDTAPRMNPELASGLAYHQSTSIERYIDQVIDCASISFPEGLTYHGYRPATPEEQLTHLTRQYRSKKNYELAPSDLYMCAYFFKFKGEELKTRYIQLPYIRPGGLIRVRGSSFVVSPVLTDNIFSITNDQIYMPVTRGKLTFKKINVNFKANGEVVSVDAIYSLIYNIKREDKHSQRESLLIHYLLAVYGVKETFRKYFGFDIVYGEEDITPQKYPSSDWVICSTQGLRPANKGYNNYMPSSMRIAVPKEHYSQTVASAVGGIFYIIDREPDMVSPEHMENILFWRRLLPRFIKSNVGLETKAMDEMNAHFESLDAYMDDLVRRRLQQEDIPRENIYDLLAHVMNTFSERTMNCEAADMITNKQLETIRPLLTDIVYSISTLTFKLWKMQGERLNLQNIMGDFDKFFPTNAIYKINRSHGEVSSLESATDLLPLAVTKSLIPQTKATSVRKSNRENEMTDPAFALHPSQCLVSTYLFITKSDPSARSSINHFLKLGPNGEVIVEPEIVKELEQLDRLLKPK